MPYPHARPPADPMRTEMARSLFAEGLSPEEWAARNAHELGTFSLDEIEYADPALDAWISRLGDILFSRDGAPSLDELRRRHLSADERARIGRERDEL